MHSPLDHFLNFENLLYYFLGSLGAPEGRLGKGKSAVFAPSTPRSSAKQIDCIFTMDYGALCPPTQEKCSDSSRRTGHCKYAVIRAGGHQRRTLGPWRLHMRDGFLTTRQNHL